MKVVYRSDKAKKEKKKRVVTAVAIAAFALVAMASVILVLILRSYTFLPSKYVDPAIKILIGVNAFLALMAVLPFIPNGLKITQTVLCMLLCAALVAADILLPLSKGKLERALISVPEEGELAIDVYVLTDSGMEKITDLGGKTLAVQTTVDQEEQEYALKLVNKECRDGGLSEPVLSEYEDIYTMTEALLAGDVDAMMLNRTYIDLLSENQDFADIKDQTVSIYTCLQKKNLPIHTDAVTSISTEPFLILVGGNDTYDYDLLSSTYDAGRTDVNILAAVNPNTKQVLMVTIPRDSYVPLWGDYDCMDKLTHATVYDLECWEDAVGGLLDCTVNYYVRLNFASMIQIVDALGGITVDNPYYFKTTFRDYTEEGVWDYLNYEYPEGEIDLNGHRALAYVRERKYMIDGAAIGDEGRNKHQAIALKAMINKATSVSVISHIGDLLDSIQGTFATDITTDEIYELVSMQLEDMSDWDLVQYNLSGWSEYATSYAMGIGSGPIFDVTMLYQDSVWEASELIQQVLDNQIVTVG